MTEQRATAPDPAGDAVSRSRRGARAATRGGVAGRLRQRLRRPAAGPAQVGPTFRDTHLQAELDERGWVVVDLLDDAAIAAVDEVISSLPPAPGLPGKGLFNDSWSTDVAYKRALSDGLIRCVTPAVEPWLTPHRTPMLATIVKWPGPEGAVPLHRDPTFVDERHYRSVGLWCALGDLGPDDGVLEVVPGSHRSSPEVRTHQSDANLVVAPPADLERSIEAVPLRAGQAMVYDHGLLHRSRAIEGPRPRVVLCGPLVPEPAQMLYTVTDAAGHDTTLVVDDDFFIDNKLDELDIVAVFDRYPHAGPAPTDARPGRRAAPGA